jgi:hypothetical protein
VEAIERNPLKTLLIGFLTLIGVPVVVLLLAATLVGLPLAVLLLVALLLALVFGPVPAVAAAGDLLLRRKGGLFGGFVLGAILWRLGIWLIPFIGAILYLVGLIWGVGGWVLGAWRVRAARPKERDALPAALTVTDDPIPDGWEYPLPPESGRSQVVVDVSSVADRRAPDTPGSSRAVEDEAGAAAGTDVSDEETLPVSSPVDPDSDPAVPGRVDAAERNGEAALHDDPGGDEPGGDQSGTDDWGLPQR